MLISEQDMDIMMIEKIEREHVDVRKCFMSLSKMGKCLVHTIGC